MAATSSAMLLHEEEGYRQGYLSIVGIDEAGRGCLAGPVFAAAVQFPEHFFHPEINDSKLLSSKKRELLFEMITTKWAVNYSIASQDAETVDRVNILQATKRAMRDAVNALKTAPDYLLVDGLLLDGVLQPVKKIIGGDRSSLSIAAASILAKVARDRYMGEMAQKFPGWGFENHKGYGTEEHLKCLEKWGPIQGFHRMTFKRVVQ